MQISGPWEEIEIHEFMDNAKIPMRLSAVGVSGYPIVASLWFLWHQNCLWSATNAASKLAKTLRNNPKCGFEISADAPPYCGVRGQAIARLSIDCDLALLRRLIVRYLGDENGALARWLLGRDSEEIAIRLEPRAMMSWDYTARMER